MNPLLEVRDLSVAYRAESRAAVQALTRVSFSVARAEAIGVVGETGSGKTTLARSLMGLTSGEVGGQVIFDGRPLPLGDEDAMREIRWRRIALAFQGSGSAFDPVYTVGYQVMEPMQQHLGLDARAARSRALALWADAGLRDELFERHPHQLSGGEKQRAMLAMALACDPELLIVDEPTSGLDILARQRIVQMLDSLRRRQGLTMIVISHDLDDVAGLAGRTVVLYAGQIAELGATELVVDEPRHPYTWGLVNAYPRMDRAKDLWGIRGLPPDPMRLPTGCPFHPRCTQAVERCAVDVPALEQHDGRLLACHLGGLQTLIRVRGLSKTFRGGTTAVRDAELAVREGEVLALIGQTGSGKTTLAKCLVGLHEPDAGEVIFEGQDLRRQRGAALQATRRRIQMIFQDPFESLSPRLTVLELVREPLDIQRLGGRKERDERAAAALAGVRLPATPAFLAQHAHQLSGGQLQRVAIARALVLEPKLIIADEPVAMLDASEQAKVLRLLKDVQNERGMGLLLISHDLALVRKVADRIAIMRSGEIIETGTAHRIIARPEHEYTRALLQAAARDGAARAGFPVPLEEVET